MDWDRRTNEVYQTAEIGSESKSQHRGQSAEETSAVNHSSEGITEIVQFTPCQYAEVDLNEIECITSP